MRSPGFKVSDEDDFSVWNVFCLRFFRTNHTKNEMVAVCLSLLFGCVRKHFRLFGLLFLLLFTLVPLPMSLIFRKIFSVLSQARKKTNDLAAGKVQVLIQDVCIADSSNQLQSNSICSRSSLFELLQINIE